LIKLQPQWRVKLSIVVIVIEEEEKEECTMGPVEGRLIDKHFNKWVSEVKPVSSCTYTIIDS
jgi:hypothetical protein